MVLGSESEALLAGCVTLTAHLKHIDDRSPGLLSISHILTQSVNGWDEVWSPCRRSIHTVCVSLFLWANGPSSGDLTPWMHHLFIFPKTNKCSTVRPTLWRLQRTLCFSHFPYSSKTMCGKDNQPAALILYFWGANRKNGQTCDINVSSWLSSKRCRCKHLANFYKSLKQLGLKNNFLENEWYYAITHTNI